LFATLDVADLAKIQTPSFHSDVGWGKKGHTILDFRLGILDWGSLAQQGFQSTNCRVLY
jgi:hypothetical protein